MESFSTTKLTRLIFVLLTKVAYSFVITFNITQASAEGISNDTSLRGGAKQMFDS